jgi:hypothetical protein
MHLSMLLREEEIRDTEVAARLPATTGGQPVPPRIAWCRALRVVAAHRARCALCNIMTRRT